MLLRVIEYIWGLLNKELAFLTPVELLILAPIMLSIYFSIKGSLKFFFKYSADGFKVTSKPIRKLYAKIKEAKKNKIICPVCKNPLHKCTCKINAGVSYKERLKNWKANQKAHEVPKVKTTKEKPVELKHKTNGGK